ncbi:MAG TPA: hypothetical protein ENN88_04840, partial [Candidatus Coatesbacteria bacterium]|nr:hypothetical protein [Candidatus Coatesbacteria bacterium]
MRVLPILLLLSALAAVADTEPGETSELPLPRVLVEDGTLHLFTDYYPDMALEGGLLVVTGTSTANLDNPNVAQARAMAQKAAKFAAQSALVEFFTDLGFSKKDAETNAGYADEYGEPVFKSDGTLEVRLAIPLTGEGGLVEAMGLAG